MRKKHLILALATMIILAVLSFLTREKDTTSGMKPGEKVFAGVKVDDIAKIELISTAAKASTVLIEKDNKWLIENKFNMDTDPAVIRKLLTALRDTQAIQVKKFKDEELKSYLLSEENTVKLKIFPKDSNEAFTFRLGKSHNFQKSSGRYIYIENRKALVLVDVPLAFAAGQASVWLKKFLPHHEQVAGVTLYSGTSMLWKTERANNKLGFSLPLPNNNNKSPKEINQMMFYAMQMRFMDITPATNEFSADPSLNGMGLYFNTFSGRTYKLTFLSKEKNLLRCTIKLLVNKAKNSFNKDYGSDEQIREELSEWHFMVPYKFYEMLFKL